MKKTMLFVAAVAIHTLTASGAAVGLFALHFIAQQQFISALWCMFASMLIDGIDGPLARKINIKQVMPKVSGQEIDHVVDFFNFGIVPAYFLFNLPALADYSSRYVLVAALVMATCYWYGRVDQQAGKYCFKRFPCLWNVLVVDIFFLDAGATVIFITMSCFILAAFIPLRYPTNAGMNVISNDWLRNSFKAVLVLTFGAIAYLLVYYPARPLTAMILAVAYWILYLLTSLFISLKRKPIKAFAHLYE